MDSNALMECQRAFFRSGVTRSEAFRRAQLQAFLEMLVAHEKDLLDALHADLRKNPQEAYASEIGFLLGEIRHALRHLHGWIKPTRRRAPILAWPSRAFVHQEPFGVALIIGPWNYPLQLLLSPLVGAIAAGNCAVLKPSEFAPQTAELIARMIHATFPAEYITVVQGGQSTAEALLLEKFDTIFFTGSTQTGRAVMSAAARHLTPVTLELGGKSPCIVCADAPLEIAARRIAWGKFMNAGQTCVAPDYVLVDHRVAAAFLATLKQVLREFYGDNPQQNPDYGRIINRRHFDRLAKYLDQGTIAHGGHLDADDLYIEPTVLTETPVTAPVMQEEIFGPILPILEFREMDALLATLADQPSPLALYLFTHDHDTQEKVLSATRSGGVCINDTITHILGKDLPFGGVGESGMGAYHGRASFDCFSHRRSVLKRSLRSDPMFRYPPHRTSLNTLKRILRLFGAG